MGWTDLLAASLYELNWTTIKAFYWTELKHIFSQQHNKPWDRLHQSYLGGTTWVSDSEFEVWASVGSGACCPPAAEWGWRTEEPILGTGADWIHGSRAPSDRLAAMELAVLRKKWRLSRLEEEEWKERENDLRIGGSCRSVVLTGVVPSAAGISAPPRRMRHSKREEIA
jgi:hypothetical protein